MDRERNCWQTTQLTLSSPSPSSPFPPLSGMPCSLRPTHRNPKNQNQGPSIRAASVRPPCCTINRAPATFSTARICPESTSQFPQIPPQHLPTWPATCPSSPSILILSFLNVCRANLWLWAPFNPVRSKQILPPALRLPPTLPHLTSKSNTTTIINSEI